MPTNRTKYGNVKLRWFIFVHFSRNIFLTWPTDVIKTLILGIWWFMSVTKVANRIFSIKYSEIGHSNSMCSSQYYSIPNKNQKMCLEFYILKNEMRFSSRLLIQIGNLDPIHWIYFLSSLLFNVLTETRKMYMKLFVYGNVAVKTKTEYVIVGLESALLLETLDAKLTLKSLVFYKLCSKKKFAIELFRVWKRIFLRFPVKMQIQRIHILL